MLKALHLYSTYPLRTPVAALVGMCLAVTATATTITTDTSISAADATYDNASLTVDGAVLTIDGAHGFVELHLTNGATLTHTANTPRLFLSISNAMTVSSNSAVDVTAKGYPGVGYADGLGPGARRV